MSFTQGLSGLSAASSDLDVIGNNVANVNTVGFKSSQAQFADVFAASLGGAGGGAQTQIGIGTKLATVAQQFTQGSVVSTSNPLDMAINGPGFFIMKGVNGVGYSRNGQFQVDKSGFIVSSTGENLQGWPATNGVVTSSGPTANLTISTASIPPVQTNSIAVGLNLDSRSAVATDVTSTGFNPNDVNSYNYSTSSTVYDSVGNARIDTMYFQLAAPSITQSASVVPAVPPGTAINNSPVIPGSSTVTFPANTPAAPNLPNIGQVITGPAGVFPPGTTVTSINTINNSFTTSQPAISPNAAPDAGGDLTFSGYINSIPTGVTGLYPGEDVGDVLGGGPSGFTIASVNTANNTFTTTDGLGGGDISALVAAAAATGGILFGPTTIAAPGITASATSSIVPVNNVAGLVVGQSVTSAAANYPAGTTITSINATTIPPTFTTSAPPGPGAVLAAGGDLTFGPVNGNQTVGTWNVYTTVADPNAAGGTYLYPAGGLPTASSPWPTLGTLSFNGITGALTPTSPTSMSLPAGFLGSFPGVSTGASAILGVGIKYDFTGATQYGASSAVTRMTVNGYTTGNLVGYSAAANGQITGSYSNGQTQLLGQVALATFADNQGLQQIGDNEWSATIASGAALTNVPGAGLNGVLQTSSVEQSNTNLTAELVNMITAQRNYQANAQTIKTQETVMQTLINMR